MLSSARLPRPGPSLLGRPPGARGSCPRLAAPAAARRPFVRASSAEALEPVEDLVVLTANADLDPSLKSSLLRSLVKGSLERERAERERAEAEKALLQLQLQDVVLQVLRLEGLLSLRGLFGELIALGCLCGCTPAGRPLPWRGVWHSLLAEYAEGRVVENPSVAAALEEAGVGGSPGRVQLWQVALATEDFAPLLGCITAATGWPPAQVPIKIDALYTHLNNIAHSGFPAVAAQLTDSYLEIPVGAVTGPDTELAACIATFFNVKFKRVGRVWRPPADE